MNGAQIAPLPNLADVEALLAHGAKLLRYQMTTQATALPSWDEATYKGWVENQCNHLDSLLPSIARAGAKVVLDLHHPWKGFETNVAAIFGSLAYDWRIMKEVWVEMAKRYANNPTILVYDLLNEPAGHANIVNDFYSELIPLVKAAAPGKRISVSSAYGLPSKFSELKFFGKSGIYYQCHFYEPRQFQSQGLEDLPTGVKYPSSKWDKRWLQGKLKAVRDFERKHNAIIYVGEFAATTMCPPASRLKWYQDCISIFENWEWHWTYHAWREWSGWNVEGTKILDELKKAWK